MKKSLVFMFFATVFFLIFSCNTSKIIHEVIKLKDNTYGSGKDDINVNLKPGKHFNHPTYAIWMEDMYGNYIRTLFITESYATGIFAYRMDGEFTWQKGSGQSYQPAALPYWTHKKPSLNLKDRVPTPDNPFIDAFSGATPKGEFIFQTTASASAPFRILLEVNQSWDWNEHWHNNKMPESPAYKRSAQPSVVYSVTIDKKQGVYHLNPEGHGDPSGETGKLFTDLSTLTTAKEIFRSATISFDNN
jgi:hypothetical protein